MVVRGSLFGCTCSASTLDRLYVSVEGQWIVWVVVSVCSCVLCVCTCGTMHANDLCFADVSCIGLGICFLVIKWISLVAHDNP